MEYYGGNAVELLLLPAIAALQRDVTDLTQRTMALIRRAAL